MTSASAISSISFLFSENLAAAASEDTAALAASALVCATAPLTCAPANPLIDAQSTACAWACACACAACAAAALLTCAAIGCGAEGAPAAAPFCCAVAALAAAAAAAAWRQAARIDPSCNERTIVALILTKEKISELERGMVNYFEIEHRESS